MYFVEVFAELSSVLLALQTPLDVKLELETRPLQPVAVLARHLRRAWEPWAAKYEPFRNDPKHARDMAAQVRIVRIVVRFLRGRRMSCVMQNFRP